MLFIIDEFYARATIMSKSIKERLSDFDDKISSASTRSGRVVQRVSNMTKAKVAPAAQAAQMTHNSPTGQTYTPQDIQSYQKLATDSEVKVVITQAQSNALISDSIDNPINEAIPST